MKTFIKKIYGILAILFMISYCSAANGIAPSYSNNFSNYFIDSNSEERVFVFPGVSENNTLAHNIRCIFYPNNGISGLGCANAEYGGYLRQIIKYIGYALVVLFIVISGVKLLMNGSNDEKTKPALYSLLYVILGSILFFGSVWILGSVLKVGTTNGTTGLANNIQGTPNSLLFIVLSFAKALAFILAILMIVIHGFKLMSNVDQSDKVKIGLKGLLNVIVALIIIKIIDYVYYIATLPTFVSEATTLIVEIAKIIGFIVGALMVIMLFYAGFLFITDQGSSENMKKAKNAIIGILVTSIVVFALLLIIYEVFSEFA